MMSQVHQLLASGANLLMPVLVMKSDQQNQALGTVLDFAYEALKEVL